MNGIRCHRNAAFGSTISEKSIVRERGFLRFHFGVNWNFEKEDNIDIFKNEFYNKTIPTLLSKDMADFLGVKLLPFMDKDKAL